MTPRFVAVGEGEIVELSTLIIKLLLLDKIDYPLFAQCSSRDALHTVIH